MFDKVILDLLSLLVAGLGLFGVILKLTTPALNDARLSATFWGANPFQLKRDQIDSAITRFYTAVTFFGFVLQGMSIIWPFPARLYSTCTYLIIFLLGLLLCWPSSFAISWFAKLYAQKHWKKEIIQSQKELFEQANEIFLNNGLNKSQVADIPKKSKAELDDLKKLNWANFDSAISQIEELLDLKNDMADRRKKIERLRKFF